MIISCNETPYNDISLKKKSLVELPKMLKSYKCSLVPNNNVQSYLLIYTCFRFSCTVYLILALYIVFKFIFCTKYCALLLINACTAKQMKLVKST